LETSGNNIYENLKTVIWTAVVSVVSFQLLGPTVWGYMHKLTSMPYQTAYKIFVIVYVLAVPVLVLGWLIRDYQLVEKYMQPTNSLTANPASRLFLYGLIGLVGLQIIVSFFFLLLPGISWKSGYYFVLSYFFMLLCLALLAGGVRLSLLRLEDARNYKRKAIENIPSPIPGRLEELESEYHYKKRKVLQQLLSILALWIFAILFWGYYFHEKRNTLFRNPQAAVIGFPLQDVRDSMDAIRKKTFQIVNDLQLENQRDSVLISTGSTLSDTSKSVILPGISRILVIKMLLKEDSLLALIDLIQDSQRVNAPLQTGAITAIRDDTANWNGLRGEHILDTMRYTDNAYPSALQKVTFQDSLITNTKYQVYTVFAYFSSTENKLDSLLKRQLGDLLRDVQATGMFLLLIVSLTLLSLYVFLKTTALSIGWELETDQLTKRIQEYIHPDEQRKLVNELETVRLEKQLAETGSLTASAWTFISLVIWLLIPFFKPVEDDKIDLNSPYKSLTFSGNGPEAIWGGTTPIIRDTVLAPSIHIDSVIINSCPTAQPGRPPVNMDSLIKAINRKVDKIEARIQPPTTP
jgi:hypothetical protein